MASVVIKKDGTRQPFDPEKIKSSIKMAAQQAGLAEDKTNEVVDKVSTAALQLAAGKEEIATSELREKILGDLDNLEPSVSAAWRKYDAEKKG